MVKDEEKTRTSTNAGECDHHLHWIVHGLCIGFILQVRLK